MQGCHGRFLTGKNAIVVKDVFKTCIQVLKTSLIVVANSLVSYSYCQCFLFLKIKPMTKPWLTCLPWWPWAVFILVVCNFKNGIIKTKKIIFATNGFLKSLGIKINNNFPITLTASMTRPLSDKEFESIGKPQEWGVLPVRPMGATIRMTKDRRILIRNTAEVHTPFMMSKKVLNI